MTEIPRGRWKRTPSGAWHCRPLSWPNAAPVWVWDPRPDPPGWWAGELHWWVEDPATGELWGLCYWSTPLAAMRYWAGISASLIRQRTGEEPPTDPPAPE